MNEFENCLNEAERGIAIPWGKYINIAQWCIETLTKDSFIYNFRGDKDNKMKNISPKQLDLYFDLMVVAWSNEDPFYYPGYFCGKDGNDITYTDGHALPDLDKILSPDFILSTDPLCENDTYFHIMALKRAFHAMSTMANPPIKTALYLAEILGEIYKQIADFHNVIQQGEDIRGQNQKNRAGVGHRLQYIEKHLIYSEIESLIERLKPDQKGEERLSIFRRLDTIIQQLIDTRKQKHDKKTIRRYRNYILSTSYKYPLLDRESIDKNRVRYGLEIDYGQKSVLPVSKN